MKILILNGPNLNLLGIRQPDIYGQTSLKGLLERIKSKAQELDMKIYHFQSNHEGLLIDEIHGALNNAQGIIFNPGALSHYSYALRDAIASIDIPVIEVHISNISAREPFRNLSVIAPVCIGQISGLGLEGYILALKFLKKYLSGKVLDKS